MQRVSSRHPDAQLTGFSPLGYTRPSHQPQGGPRNSMLSPEQNQLICEVGPGTPGGEMLRRYWHPIGGLSELDEDPVVYRDRSGRLGLLGALCPHRRTSLEYGIPEQEGLRCCYHGWLFDNEGRCLEQPAEPAESVFKDKIRHVAYPVQELGGL